MEDRDKFDAVVFVNYFAMTTLSTVGFGDVYPRSNDERIVCIFLFLFGVSNFSLIMGDFIGLISMVKEYKATFDDSENLSKFLSTL